MITIVGFLATIRGVRQARHAAEEARRSAREAVFRVHSRLLQEEFGDVVAIVRGADSACGGLDWGRAIERCDEARIRLARLGEDERLDPDDRAAIGSFVNLLGGLIPTLRTLLGTGSTRSLPAPRMKQFHEILIKLSQIQGRLQSDAWEV